ncbi:putative e9imm peptide [Paenibacillus sp. 598K]|uniref:bacteriocin immunity protein n=1 Tax=Paenibacillus sp. 598K TaxID=1117987 RepID=UPI000FF9C028|nr:bacteriocin immunity protein [Paenibacillus sp. 598K]GBF75677.1 putative e9imm peptide [Paenibacillus sp. 598K]
MNHLRSKEELVELVDKIMNDAGTEEEIDAMIDELRQHVPHPSVTDLIFWPEEELTAEEIVERALDYRPIILPPPANDAS